jgi:hypothetical protein
MSDFLGQLVARSLTPSPAVQPRVRSLFEPVQGAVAPLAGEPPGPASAHRSEVERVDSSPAGDNPGRVAPKVPQIDKADEAVGVPLASAHKGSPRPVQVENSGELEAERRQSQSPSPAREDDATTDVPLSAIKREREVVPLIPARDEGKPPVESPEGSGRDHRASPPPATAANTTQLKPKVAAPRPEPNVSEPVSRVIQVTIGRVEIRAVVPPQGPARTRPVAASPRSLEDYLNRRHRRHA